MGKERQVTYYVLLYVQLLAQWQYWKVKIYFGNRHSKVYEPMSKRIEKRI